MTLLAAWPRMPRSASLRQSMLYTTAFAATVAILGAMTIVIVHAALARQFDQRIASDSAAMTLEFRQEGLKGVTDSIREHDQTAGALDFGFETPAGAPVAGALDKVSAPPGWSMVRNGQGAENGSDRVLVTLLPGGYRVLVGDNLAHVRAVDAVVIRDFGAAFIVVVLLGGLLGYAMNRGVQGQIAQIRGTAQAIIDGDLSRRMPVGGGDDELDRLASTLNRMLDRIAALLESLRQVSTDIAHDLRTPLTRLRQRLESSLAGPNVEERADAVAAGLSEIDAIMGVFAAVLRIAEIESGVRRVRLRPIDLAALARTVVDAFAPSAEDGGGALTLAGASSLTIDGDPELVTQMMVNLVENALRHAGPAARILVCCERLAGAPTLFVADNGPGVPAAERRQVFDRFHRLEASRSTPGSGLGLALVAAVTKLHGAAVTLHDAAPGLRVEVVFPPSARTG